MAVLVDDAHWLDDSSAQALLFAFRRLVADPIAVLLAVREGEPSLLDGADLPTLRIGGLSERRRGDAAAGRWRRPRRRGCTARRPATRSRCSSCEPDAPDARARAGGRAGPRLRADRARVRPAARHALDEPARRALVLAATSDSGDLPMLERAAARLGDRPGRARRRGARRAGRRCAAGAVEFRHPLARSAIYADAPAAQRRAAHRALAGALPDRDVDRRAWHLASAAVGADDAASAALEQAGVRSRERSAYATAAAAFERAGAAGRRPRAPRAPAVGGGRRGLARRAAPSARVALLDEARAGHRRTRAAGRDRPARRPHRDAPRPGDARPRDPRRRRRARRRPSAPSAMLGRGGRSPASTRATRREMLAVAERARAALPADASTARPLPRRHRVRDGADPRRRRRGRGGGDPRGDRARRGLARAARRPRARSRGWRSRRSSCARPAPGARCSTHALSDRAGARRGRRAAVRAQPDRPRPGDRATAGRSPSPPTAEAIELARESGQRADLVFGLAGLAWLQARRGRERGVPRAARPRRWTLSGELGTRLHEVWATAALGELELGLGRGRAAVEHFERQQRARSRELRSPTSTSRPRAGARRRLPAARARRRRASASPRSFAAAARGQGPAVVARPRAGAAAGCWPPTTSWRAASRPRSPARAARPTRSRTARTRLAYGAAPAARRGGASSPASSCARRWTRSSASTPARGPTARAPSWPRPARRCGGATRARVDELTPQELQIALLLAGGQDDARGGGRAVPQPEDDRVPPAPRLPEARHPLARGARAALADQPR